jgi:hypothetical protein
MKFDEDSYLEHFGIPGMKWGRRKVHDDGIPDSTHRMAKKDAQRHMDAKMFYGETAGTKRKLLKAEIEKKKKTIPGYEQAFTKHLENVDTAKSAKKAVAKRTRIDSVANGRRLVKKIFNITGPITVAAAGAVYYANKEKIDRYVMDQFNKILSK